MTQLSTQLPANVDNVKKTIRKAVPMGKSTSGKGGKKGC